MAASGRSVSRRSFIISGFAAASARGEGAKGGTFPSDATRYADPATELDVYRLTDLARSFEVSGAATSFRAESTSS